MGLKHYYQSSKLFWADGPQSNQRGIETFLTRKPLDQRVVGLNRTSVGLKRELGVEGDVVGIRLNRTSVGLKPAWIARLRPG